MGEMNDQAKDDPWMEFPEKFREICSSVYLSDNKYTCAEAVEYLLQQKETADDLLFARMVDRFFKDDMYPLELKDDEWKNLAPSIEVLLKKSEAFLLRCGGTDCTHKPYKDVRGSYDEKDTVCLRQDLDVYFFTLYKLTDDLQQADLYLRRILEETEQNVLFLLTLENAEERVTLEQKWSRLYFPGNEYWQEPLAWVYQEALFGEYADMLAGVYERYGMFLKKTQATPANAAARELLLRDNVKRRRRLYNYALEELEERIEELEDEAECLRERSERYMMLLEEEE